MNLLRTMKGRTARRVKPAGERRVPPPSRGRPGGFTMVEIALSLAIIAFALVAIIGVLPSGMTVQRDNRWDTIVNEDGQLWLNAIRQGAKTVPELNPNRVSSIEIETNAGSGPFSAVFNDSTDIIGLMSRPTAVGEKPNKAQVRAISSSAAEQGDADVGLEYVLFSTIHPFVAASEAVSSNLFEARLVFRWPAFPDGTFGRSKKVFRTLIRGQLTESNRGPNVLHFFDSQTLQYNPPSGNP